MVPKCSKHPTELLGVRGPLGAVTTLWGTLLLNERLKVGPETGDRRPVPMEPDQGNSLRMFMMFNWVIFYRDFSTQMWDICGFSCISSHRPNLVEKGWLLSFRSHWHGSDVHPARSTCIELFVTSASKSSAFKRSEIIVQALRRPMVKDQQHILVEALVFSCF